MTSSRTLFFLCLLSFASSFAAQAEEILVIGDSLSCGGFGEALVPALAGTKNHVTLYCAVSANSDNWLDGTNPVDVGKIEVCKTWTSNKPKAHLCGGSGHLPTVKELLRGKNDVHVIIALGTNTMAAGAVSKADIKLAHYARSHSAKCEWIGPPHVAPNETNRKVFPKNQVIADEKGLDGFYTSLLTTINPICEVTDSREATKPGTPGGVTMDGVHRSLAAGQYWVDHILADDSASLTSSRLPTAPMGTR